MLLAVICLAGSCLVQQKNIRNHRDWMGHHLQEGSFVVAHLLEPPVEKPNSYKALAAIDGIINNNSGIKTKGKALLYFKKDTSIFHLTYGTTIVFKIPLAEIRNSGNPAAFDFKQYASFAG